MARFGSMRERTCSAYSLDNNRSNGMSTRSGSPGVEGPVICGRKDSLDQQVERFGRPVFERAVPVKNVEGFQYLESRRVWRRYSHVQTAIGRGYGLTPGGLVRRQVFAADEPARGRDALAHPVPQLAPVERLLSPRNHLGHRFGQRGLPQHRADWRRFTVAIQRVGRPANFGMPFERPFYDLCVHRRYGVAVGSVVDGFFEQLIERQAPVRAVHCEPARQVSRHQRSARPCATRELVEHLGAGGRGSAAGEIERTRAALRLDVHQSDSDSPHAGHIRLNHIEGARHRNGRIYGVPALPQGVQASVRRQTGWADAAIPRRPVAGARVDRPCTLSMGNISFMRPSRANSIRFWG